MCEPLLILLSAPRDRRYRRRGGALERIRRVSGGYSCADAPDGGIFGDLSSESLFWGRSAPVSAASSSRDDSSMASVCGAASRPAGRVAGPGDLLRHDGAPRPARSEPDRGCGIIRCRDGGPVRGHQQYFGRAGRRDPIWVRRATGHGRVPGERSGRRLVVGRLGCGVAKADREAQSTPPRTPPVTKVVNSSSEVTSPLCRRPNAHTTKVTGTRKLPSSTSVGTRLGLPVAKVTTTVRNQSTNPVRNSRAHAGDRARHSDGGSAASGRRACGVRWQLVSTLYATE